MVLWFTRALEGLEVMMSWSWVSGPCTGQQTEEEQL